MFNLQWLRSGPRATSARRTRRGRSNPAILAVVLVLIAPYGCLSAAPATDEGPADPTSPSAPPNEVAAAEPVAHEAPTAASAMPPAEWRTFNQTFSLRPSVVSVANASSAGDNCVVLQATEGAVLDEVSVRAEWASLGPAAAQLALRWVPLWPPGGGGGDPGEARSATGGSPLVLAGASANLSAEGAVLVFVQPVEKPVGVLVHPEVRIIVSLRTTGLLDPYTGGCAAS